MYRKFPAYRQNNELMRGLGSLLCNTVAFGMLAAWGVELLVKAMFGL